MSANMCEYCLYYEFDETCGEWSCVMDMSEMDQDDREALYAHSDGRCPLFHMGDEYTVVRKQN